MDTNLVIVDEYVTDAGKDCKTRGADVLDNTVFTEYINTLKSIKSGAIKEGDISDALDAYIECAELMKAKLAAISESVKTICESFINEVDGIDQYTF